MAALTTSRMPRRQSTSLRTPSLSRSTRRPRCVAMRSILSGPRFSPGWLSHSSYLYIGAACETIWDSVRTITSVTRESMTSLASTKSSSDSLSESTTSCRRGTSPRLRLTASARRGGSSVMRPIQTCKESMCATMNRCLERSTQRLGSLCSLATGGGSKNSTSITTKRSTVRRRRMSLIRT